MIREKRVEISIQTLAPLHIGGQDNPLTGMENAVAKIGERLVIPGPSIKGALRHQMEDYLIEANYDDKARGWPQERLSLRPCMASAGRVSAEEAALVNAGKYRNTSARGSDVRSGCVYPSEASICPVCYLLGAQGLTGFIRVSFLEADQQPDALYSGRVDRAKGIIAHGTNRPYELVREGTTFRGFLSILDSDDVRSWTFGQPRRLEGNRTPDRWLESGEWDAKRILDELIVKRLQAITIIGGYRSKGFGLIKVTVGS